MPVSESRVAIVTGASSGLGNAIACGLLDDGWTVAGFDISKNSSQDLEDEYSDRFTYYQADVADYDSQAAAFSKVFEKYGRIDALCANAGIIDRGSIYISAHRGKTEIPPKPDLATTDVDYKGVVYGTQLAIHFMRQNPQPGGAIMATASVCAYHPIESLPEYSGAKAAVVAFARATAPILKSKENITINVVCPGCLPTPAIPQPMRDFFGSNLTPLSAIVQTYKTCLTTPTLTGQIFEVAGSTTADHDVVIQPRPFNSDATRMAGTVFEPLFVGVHGVGSGLGWSQGVGLV